jgi:hypothetical protein
MALAQETSAPVKVIEGSEPGVRAEILSLKHTDGDLLTLRVAFVNESGGEVSKSALPGAGNLRGFSLMDFRNKRRYSVLTMNDESCVCSELPLGAVGPGRHVLWAKLSAPPGSVDRISLLLPDGSEPVEGVPISK